MEIVTFEFYKVYEPGELQAPMVQPENGNDSITQEMRSVPRYKDQFNFGAKKYFVHDIIYDMNAGNGTYKVIIKLYRKIGVGELDG